MQMVAADWLKSDKREDDLGSRPGGIVQVLLMIESPLLILEAYKLVNCRNMQQKVDQSSFSS